MTSTFNPRRAATVTRKNVAHSRLPSVGSPSRFRFFAVSLRHDVSHKPGGRLPSAFRQARSYVSAPVCSNRPHLAGNAHSPPSSVKRIRGPCELALYKCGRDDREISFLFQRLSVLIQRYNAILLRDWRREREKFIYHVRTQQIHIQVRQW